MHSFPVLVLGFLFVSFHPSRFRSHSCSTGASLLFRFRFSSGLFCSPSAFFRLLLLASDYSAFRSFFSLLPVFPWQRFLRCTTVSFVPVVFLFRPACFHAFLLIPVLGFLHFLSPLAVSPHSSYLSASAFFLSAPGFFPFAFALGSGYLALSLSGSSQSL